MDLPTFEELFKQLKLNFWLIGIPYDSPKITLRFYVLFLTLFLMIIEEGSFFVSKISAENILELAELAPCTCTGILSCLKLLSMVLKRRKIFQLTHNLGELYQETFDNVEKKKLVQKNILTVKSFTKYYLVLNSILISTYNFYTLIYIPYHYYIENELVFSLPYAVLLPFSTDSWPTWFVVYMHSIFSGMICVLYFTTVDALYCIMTCLVCSNFTIISDDIKRLKIIDVPNLKEIVVKHQYILKLSEDLEEIFTESNLFNVLVGSFEICALGFNLTTGDWTRVPGFILFILSVLLQILMMSVFGENLIRESTKVGDAAFHCEWYGTSEKSKKIILILMTRSNKPCRLTAYKFSVINYVSFTKIISTSWSYFTILKTIYTPGNTVHTE